jgi:hypothetical protein
VLGISPDESITCRTRSQVLEGLPLENHGAIVGSIDELPLHRLQVAHNLRSFEKVAHNRVASWIVGDGISKLGDEVKMLKLGMKLVLAQ